MAQLYTIYNAKAQSSIGSNDMFKYENIKPLIPAQTANIDKTDDDTDWMMHSQKNMPYIMTDYSKLVRSDYSKLVINVSDLSSLFSTQLFQDLFNMSIDNLSVIIQYDNDTLKSDRLKYGGSNPNSLTPSYIPGQIYNGSSFKGNLQQIFHEDLEPNDVEKSIFNYILYKLIFTNDADWFTSTMARSSSLWAYNLLTDQNNANANFLDIKIYDLFHQQEQEQELNLSSTYSYALEFYKFKYYLSHQLMGYYGTDDITTQNYESTQKEEIIVPWSQYFKFCFLPQYNAYTCRCADELNSKFDDSPFLVELKKLDEDIEQKIPPVWNLFRRCCLAFPSLSDKNSNYNVLTSLIQKNFDFNTGKDETVYRFSSSYDGTATPSAQYANFFKQYDIKKADWSTWAETDKNFSYGWFSESGLRSQALVNWASESNKTSVNYFGSPTVLYHNQIYTNKVDAFFFQYAAFTFDTVDRVHSGGLYIIYMLISGLLLYVGYNQYVKHDFQ